MTYAPHRLLKNSSGKVLSLLSLALALVSCAAAVYLFTQWQGAAGEKKNFEAARIQLQDQVNVLKQDLEGVQKEKVSLTNRLNTAGQDKAQQLQAAAAMHKKNTALLQTELEAAKKELAALKAELEKVRASAASAPAAAGAGEPQKDEAIQIQMLPNDTMRIKTINRKFNFAVLTTVPGKALQTGDALRVERDGRWVADLTVQKTYDEFASAAIKKESEKDALQTGDVVTQAP